MEKIVIEKDEREVIYSSTLIYIDVLDEGEISGAFRNLHSPADVPFYNIAELFLRLDHRLDELNSPQAFMARRTWRVKKKTHPKGYYAGPIQRPDRISDEEIAHRCGKEATLLLQVYTRQNASWQGTVQWLEGRKTLCFRSALELLWLLYEAAAKQDMQKVI